MNIHLPLYFRRIEEGYPAGCRCRFVQKVPVREEVAHVRKKCFCPGRIKTVSREYFNHFPVQIVPADQLSAFRAGNRWAKTWRSANRTAAMDRSSSYSFALPFFQGRDRKESFHIQTVSGKGFVCCAFGSSKPGRRTLQQKKAIALLCTVLKKPLFYPSIFCFGIQECSYCLYIVRRNDWKAPCTDPGGRCSDTHVISEIPAPPSVSWSCR